MKRIFSILAAAAAATLGFGQVKLNVLASGKMIGSVSFSSKITQAGGLLNEFSMTVDGPGKQAFLRTQTTFDASGRPIRKFQALNVGNTSQRRQVVVTFEKDGARVQFVPIDSGKGAVIPYPDGKLPKEPEEFWFIRDHPKPGTSISSYSFDMEHLKWDPYATTFVGREEIVLNGHQVVANKIHVLNGTHSSTEYLDDKGLPFRVEAGQLVFERTAP